MRPLPQHMGSLDVMFSAMDFADDDNDEPTGFVAAVVASLEVADAYGRIVHVGSVGNQEIVISDWGHSAVFGKQPVATAVAFEEGQELHAHMHYDMSDPDSAKAYRTVRRNRNIQQWSIAYDGLDMEERGGQLHFWSLELMEGSPVLRGASPNTRTLQVQDRSRVLRPGSAWLETAKMKAEIAARRMV